MSISTMLMTASAAAQPSGAMGFFLQFFPLLLIFLIFYMLMIRPQQKRIKEHAATIASVKKGDDVITGGGIRGRVTKVGDDEVEVEIAQGTRVKVVKSTLSQIVGPNTKPAND